MPRKYITARSQQAAQTLVSDDVAVVPLPKTIWREQTDGGVRITVVEVPCEPHNGFHTREPGVGHDRLCRRKASMLAAASLDVSQSLPS